jgi:hypothetical protein
MPIQAGVIDVTGTIGMIGEIAVDLLDVIRGRPPVQIAGAGLIDVNRSARYRSPFHFFLSRNVWLRWFGRFITHAVPIRSWSWPISLSTRQRVISSRWR